MALIGDLAAIETVAQLVIAIAGFTEIVLALGRRTHGDITPIEHGRLLDLLGTAIGTAFICFCTRGLRAFLENSASAWRLSHGLFGAFNLYCLSTFYVVIRNKPFNEVGKNLVWIPFGLISIAALLLVSFGFFQPFAYGIYLAALLWLLFVSAWQFSLLLLADNAPPNKSLHWPPVVSVT